tara:strand:- start:263 stop:1120 length:858 start_codon:yes stop_codon:yes gene_type:complete
MSWFKKTADFFLFSNIFVAYCVVALCMSTEFLLEHYSYTINLFVFFASLFTYNFQRLVRMRVQGELSFRQQWLQQNKFLLWVVTALSAIATVYFSLSLSYNSLRLLLPLGIIAFMYSLPLLYWKGRWWRLREVPGIKIFLIALVWALVSVGLLVEEHQIGWTIDVWLLFLHRLCFVFAITIPFDIRDLKYDSLQLKTIPTVFGAEKARYIAYAALVMYELLVVAQFIFGDIIGVRALIALLCTSAATAYLLIKTTSDKGEYHFVFWIEGASALMNLFLMTALFFF